jgi:hypothetical protein
VPDGLPAAIHQPTVAEYIVGIGRIGWGVIKSAVFQCIIESLQSTTIESPCNVFN